MPRLYEIARGSKIRVELNERGKARKAIITFDHIDGMYSYCTTDKEGVVHLGASTPLNKGKDGIYVIDYDAQ